MRHATDPDHVVAITTIVAKQRGIARAGLIGALWGLGHTFTIFVVGTMIILFQVTISPRVGLSMEFAVAAMLILLGVLNLTGTLRWLQERFTPGARVPEAIGIRVNGGPPVRQVFESSVTPQAAGVASRVSLDRMFRTVGLYNILRPLVIGIVYLLLFGVGTIAGMMIITCVLAMPFTFTAAKFAAWNRRLGVASGLLSLGFGLFLSYHIAFVDGLFTAHPQWTPQ